MPTLCPALVDGNVASTGCLSRRQTDRQLEFTMTAGAHRLHAAALRRRCLWSLASPSLQAQIG